MALGRLLAGGVASAEASGEGLPARVQILGSSVATVAAISPHLSPPTEFEMVQEGSLREPPP